MKKKKYTYNKEQIIEWHEKGYNSVYITTNLLGYPKYCYKTVAKIIKSEGRILNGRRKQLTDKEIEDICNLYKQGKTQAEIFEKYKNKIGCESTIWYYLNKCNIQKRRTGSKSCVQYHDYFETIDSEKKAYFLGLFLADGSICHNSKTNEYNNINLGLKQEDEYLIKIFAKEIGFTGKLYKETLDQENYIRRKRFAKDGFTSIRFTSNKMANDLAKYDIFPKKSNKERISENIPKKYMNHFISGMFDGDGSVYVSNNYLHVSYYGSHEICQQLKNMFELKNKVYDKENISFISFQKKESVKKFYDFIYKDATIYMRRKKEKFDKNLC